MGRGRAKAKQTKVARELKYFSPNTDLTALQRELHGSSSTYEEPERTPSSDDEDDYQQWASGDR
ncbi:MAG TPA: DUF3073 domain-containing protein [Actinomycetales bacterium]|jgi:hypothetical protein|nr:DUF3073 domain-containing protein [Actinomycetales bacterium]